MARANFQVLVLPFARENGRLTFGVLRRADMGIWQFVSGGGEDDETPRQAALRELREETGFCAGKLYALDTCCSIPVNCFRKEDRARWGEDCFVVTEYAFAVEVPRKNLVLSHEHSECAWLPGEEAKKVLKYDSNRTALWELQERIAAGKLAEFTVKIDR